jgi:hypothetical protein
MAECRLSGRKTISPARWHYWRATAQQNFALIGRPVLASLPLYGEGVSLEVDHVAASPPASLDPIAEARGLRGAFGSGRTLQLMLHGPTDPRGDRTVILGRSAADLLDQLRREANGNRGTQPCRTSTRRALGYLILRMGVEGVFFVWDHRSLCHRSLRYWAANAALAS